MKSHQLILMICLFLCSSTTSLQKSSLSLQRSSLQRSFVMKQETAIFALGCFWSPQSKFSKLEGVYECFAGYTGGNNDAPNYKSVCNDDGHTEAIFLKYDDDIITYEQLLQYYFDSFKTQPYITSGQYALQIWTNNDDERILIGKVGIEKGVASLPVVAPMQKFYKAEMYHQDFEKKNTVRYLFLIVGVILSLLPNLDPLFYKAGALITMTYIVITLIERFTNVDVNEIKYENI